MTDTTDVNTVQVSKKGPGQPTKLEEHTVQVLEMCIQRGLSIQTACAKAKIGRSTYYYWMDNDKDFLDRMESAKVLVTVKAADNISNAILNEDKPNLELSKWWLERKEHTEFGSKGNIMMQQNNPVVNNNIYVKTTPSEVGKRFDQLFGGPEDIHEAEFAEGTAPEQTT